MVDLLVCLRDEKYREEIEDLFKASPYFCHIVTNKAKTLEMCERELIDILLVWPGDYEFVSDLIRALKIRDKHFIPLVPVIEKNNGFQGIMRLQIADLILIPTSRREFFAILDGLIAKLRQESIVLQGKYWQGSLFEIELPDLIHRIEMSARDALMTITDKGHFGQIYFGNGEVLRASFRSLEGMAALKKMCALKEATFRVHFTRVKVDPTVDLQNQEIIGELGNYMGDCNKLLKSLPDSHLNLHKASEKVKSDALNDVQKGIMELCKNGESVYDMMLLLNYDNLDILQHVKALLDQGLLIDASSGERADMKKKGLGEFIDSLGLFFKKDREKSAEQAAPAAGGTGNVQDSTPVPITQTAMKKEIYHKLDNFFEKM